jgi:hypothetical protein
MGTWWLIECFTLGSAENTTYLTKLIKLLSQSQIPESNLSLFARALIMKYDVQIGHPLYDTLTQMIAKDDDNKSND